ITPSSESILLWWWFFGGYTYLLPGSPRCEPGEQLVALIEGEIREAHHEACAGTTPCGPLGQQPCRAERGAARRGPEQSRGARRRGPGGPGEQHAAGDPGAAAGRAAGDRQPGAGR